MVKLLTRTNEQHREGAACDDHQVEEGKRDQVGKQLSVVL